MRQLHVRVGGAQEDARYAEDLTRELEELLLRRSPAESVERVELPARPGEKGVGMDVAQLVVGFAGALPALVEMVRSWRGRADGARVEIELDGDKLVLDDATPEQQQALVDAFLARHAD